MFAVVFLLFIFVHTKRETPDGSTKNPAYWIGIPGGVQNKKIMDKATTITQESNEERRRYFAALARRMAANIDAQKAEEELTGDGSYVNWHIEQGYGCTGQMTI